MDDIKTRLQECAAACLKSYEAWEAKKGAETTETLQDSIHELRKVASRLEIEITLSERKNSSSKPIPIPAHRSNSKSKGSVESILPDEGNTEGNAPASKDGARRSRTRRPAKRKE